MSAPSNLEASLAAVVHHVELCKGGWRERALDLLVLTTCFWADSTIERDVLLTAINEQLNVPIGRAQLESTVRRLCSKGSLVEPSPDACRVSESARLELVSNFEQAEVLDEELGTRFESGFSGVSGAEPPTWQSFKQDFLYPLVDELGAKTYEILSTETDRTEESASYLNYLSRFPKELRGVFSDVISAFFDPTNPSVRRFVLNRLNATFLVRATALTEAALSAIAEATSQRLEMKVFVDTNFLFSLVALHENPADDVVEALDSLIRKTGGNTDVKLYVLPITLDEARSTIGLKRDELQGIVMDRQLARSVVHGTTDFSGITLKYLREMLTSEARVSASDYFEPYLENMVEICRANGVELYNKDLSGLHQDQEVVDDLLREREHQEKNRAKGAKPYPVLRHDMVLWHFVSRQRLAGIESAVDAGFWIATLDFGLLAFDRYKKRQSGARLPLAIHPTVLLQMLQFWVPQSAELEIALVNSLQPMLPHEFDSDAERVSIKILRVLSRFDNVNDLGSETVGRIFVDRALRARVSESDDIDAHIQMVESAIIEEARQLREEVRYGQEERSALLEQEGVLHQELASRNDKLKKIEAKLSELRRESEEQKSAADKAREVADEERARTKTLQERLERIEEIEAARTDNEVTTRHRLWFTVGAILILALLISVATTYVAPWLERSSKLGIGTTTALALAVAVAGGLLIAEAVGRRFQRVRAWYLFRGLHRFRKCLWGALAAVGTGLLVIYLGNELGL